MSTTTATRSHRYQRWSGELDKGRSTWLAIVVTGIHLAFKQARTRTLVMSVALVTLGTCAVLYVLSLLETLVGTPEAHGVYDFLQAFLGVDVSGVSRIEELRGVLWGTLFLVMIKAEMFWVLIVVAQIGPGLIAKDLRFRALPIYFAKPLTPLTYVLGKWLVVAFFIALVTLIPNLGSLLLGSMMTGGLGTMGQLLNLGLDLLLSGLLACVVGGTVVLALSSLTSDHRYVTVAWLAVCLLPVFAQAIVDELLPGQSRAGLLGCISLRDDMVILTEWLFGLRDAWEASGLPTRAFGEALAKPIKPLYPALVLAGWTVVAALVCYRRVVRFSRSAANV